MAGGLGKICRGDPQISLPLRWLPSHAHTTSSPSMNRWHQAAGNITCLSRSLFQQAARGEPRHLIQIPVAHVDISGGVERDAEGGAEISLPLGNVDVHEGPGVRPARALESQHLAGLSDDEEVGALWIEGERLTDGKPAASRADKAPVANGLAGRPVVAENLIIRVRVPLHVEVVVRAERQSIEVIVCGSRHEHVHERPGGGAGWPLIAKNLFRAL